MLLSFFMHYSILSLLVLFMLFFRLQQELEKMRLEKQIDLPPRISDTLNEARKKPTERVPVKFNLKGTELSDAQLEILIAAIRRCPFVRKLDISKTKISSAGFQALANFLKWQAVDALSGHAWDSCEHTCVYKINLPNAKNAAILEGAINNLLPICRHATSIARIRLAFKTATRGSNRLPFSNVEQTIFDAIGHNAKSSELQRITDSEAPGCDHVEHTMDLDAFQEAVLKMLSTRTKNSEGYLPSLTAQQKKLFETLDRAASPNYDDSNRDENKDGDEQQTSIADEDSIESIPYAVNRPEDAKTPPIS